MTRVAIVTGAGMGIGAATAMVMAENGIPVLVADRDETAGPATVEAIRAAGGEAVFFRVDVADEAQVEAMVAAAVARFGRLDYAVNNAGIRPDGAKLADLDVATFDRIIAVNLRSVALCLKYQLRQMMRQGDGGAIVNTASVNALRPQAGQPGYIAAKAGVVALTRSASLDYAPHGIRVNAVAPGLVETPMLTGLIDDYGIAVEDLYDVSLFRRCGRPREVAEAIHWLCSDRASLVTGVVLPVDAGYAAA